MAEGRNLLVVPDNFQVEGLSTSGWVVIMHSDKLVHGVDIEFPELFYCMT